MIPRHIAPHILKYAKEYPILALVGPRQSGKTTFKKTIQQWFKLEGNTTDRGCVIYSGEQTIDTEGPIPIVPWYSL